MERRHPLCIQVLQVVNEDGLDSARQHVRLGHGVLSGTAVHPPAAWQPPPTAGGMQPGEAGEEHGFVSDRVRKVGLATLPASG